jgi:hypothetical protein
MKIIYAVILSFLCFSCKFRIPKFKFGKPNLEYSSQSLNSVRGASHAYSNYVDNKNFTIEDKNDNSIENFESNLLQKKRQALDMSEAINRLNTINR